MTISYKNILDNMQKDYYEKSGKNLDLNSETGARLQAVASELFSLNCYADYILKQAFAKTADGKYLDSHAKMRGINRKSASKSRGVLRFYGNLDDTSDILIPKGVICCDSTNPYRQFVTLEEKLITADKHYVDVNAESLECGDKTNAMPNTITVIVNPPIGVVSVVNSDSFIGGCDAENDSKLRSRVLNSYRVPSNGFNEQSYVDTILDCDEVLDCNIRITDMRFFMVYLKTRDGKISDKLYNEIHNKLDLINVSDLQLVLKLAQPINLDLYIEIVKNDEENTNIEEDVARTAKQVVDACRMGESLNLGKIVSAVSQLKGVKYCEVSSDLAVNNSIYVGFENTIELRDCKVVCYD